MTTWRPLRAAGSGPSDRGEPRPVRDSLEGLAARLGAPSSASLSAVFSHWEEVVGPAVAAHCRPSTLVRGTLVVEVDDPVWATQLRYLAATIVERLTAGAGPDAVTRVDVRVRRR